MHTTAHPHALTALTLAAAAAAIAAVLLHWSLAIGVLPVVLLPRLAPATVSHGWREVAKLTLTTFCFGVVDGVALRDIFLFVEGGWEGPVPLMQAYLFLLTVYHYFQFQLVNCFHHSSLSWHSFLLYHSKPYMIATAFMLVEHLTTKYLFGFSYKDGHLLMLPGLALMAIGEGLRIAAFFTCKRNFTHLVRYKKVAGHELVTNGVYSVFRHPSYTGYFYFSVGGQLLLGNLLSSLLFAVVLIRFFRDRIEDEEIALASFFPEYPAYQARTWICIPFVRGVPPERLLLRYEFED